MLENERDSIKHYVHRVEVGSGDLLEFFKTGILFINHLVKNIQNTQKTTFPISRICSSS